LQSAQQAAQEPVASGVSAVELLRREVTAGAIRTGAAGLDALLGRGVPAGKLSEFCGAPGVGKTQLGYRRAHARTCA
jgi:RAD51-like protein 2